MTSSTRKASSLFSFVVFILSAFVLIYFVFAVPSAPTSIYFEGNTSSSYDKEGTFSVNWTAANETANYTIWRIFNANTTIADSKSNDSTTGAAFSTLAEGNYSFNISAQNATGDWGPNATSAWIIVDLTNPSVGNLSLNVTSSKHNSSVRINATIDDTNRNNNWAWASGDGGATNRTMSNIGSNNFQINTTPFNVGCSPDAACTVRIFAVDNANNTNGSVTVALTVDDTPPTVSVVSYTNATQKRNNQQLTLNVSVSDSGVGLSGTCFIWASTSTANNTVSVSSGWCNSTTLALTGAADGNQTLNIFLNDTLGNTRLNDTYAVWIDTTSPTVSIVSYTNATQKRNNQQLTLNVSVSDSGVGLSGTCFIWASTSTANNTVSVSSGWCNSTTIALTGATDGNQTLNIFLNDTLGNTRLNDTYAVWIDTTIPNQLSIVTPTPVAYANLSQSFIEVNFTFTENYTSYCIFEFTGASPVNVTNTSVAFGNGRLCFYNRTSLTDGNYTLKVYVNDTFGNINSTSNRTIYLDTAGPSITFSCSPTSVYLNELITCSCSATDSGTGVSSTSYTANPATSSTGTSSTSCTSTDYAGNSGTSTASYTVSSRSTGGAGGGGGGGTASTSPSGTKASYSFASIDPLKPVELKLENKNVGIDAIMIKTDIAASSVDLDIIKLDSKPAVADTLQPVAYRFIEIKVTNLAKASITLDFKVEKSWLASNNIEKATLSLYRYSGKWNKITTKIMKEDSAYIYLQSYLTGFSTFSIAGDVRKAECSSGEKRCAGNNIEQCSSDGRWIVTETCTNGCGTISKACIAPPQPPQLPEEGSEATPEQPPQPAEKEPSAYPDNRIAYTVLALAIILLAVFFLIKSRSHPAAKHPITHVKKSISEKKIHRPPK